ncbi:MAG: MOSC domain-containing protein [Fuerstiella sp.]
MGQTLAIGDVRLQIERPCPRCIMTTLSQDELSKDPNILRTAVQQNAGNVGVYATVTSAGQVRRGDGVVLSGPDD